MKTKIFLAILLLSFVLRFYKLGQIPLSLDWDENSNAYNAYSILKTGRDEYGTFLPITNRSFDDYKPPLYMYLNIPTVAIFGLTPIAARLPSAIFGFLTVPVIYFLTKILFSDLSKQKKEITALISMLFVAISPWHIQFSRVGFEANVGLFFAVSSITTFLLGFSNKKWLIPSAFLLGLSAYSYHTQRIFVPLLFLAAFAIYKKQIFQISKKYLASFVVLTILVGLPLVILIPPKVILQRFEVTTGRPNLEDIERSIKFIEQDSTATFAKYIHNRRLVIGQTWFGNYLSHFSPNFLFTKGDDNFRHHIQNMGMVYFFELPLLLIGIYLLIKKKTKGATLILMWLLLAPVAATPATPTPHANRSLPMDVPLQIISAYALTFILFYKKSLTKIVIIISSIWISLSFLIYIHNYYSHYPYEMASFWQYGYKEAVLESEKIKDNYESIHVSKSIEQAYAFWLFNTKYDPGTFQKEGSRYHFDKYYFDEEKPPESSNELFISDFERFPDSFIVIKQINYPNGTPAVMIGRHE